MEQAPSLDLREVRYRALADPTRRHLLRVLDDFGGPVDVAALAALVDLHVNTVRGHLDLLEEAQLVERTTERREVPGRPKVLYRAVPRDARSPATEGYRFLAEVLASSLQATSTAPQRVAEEAGKAWGRYLVERPRPFERVHPARAVEQAVTTLAELGFAPDVVDEGDVAFVVQLHDCPFREVAKTHGQVVCSVHLGLLRGMMEELGDPVRVASLEPFAGPSLCLARLECNDER